MLKKNSVAEAVAADMAGIMESDEYRAIFAKPVVPAKTATDEIVAGTPKTVNSKREKFKLVVQGMAKLSEVLDELGLPRSAVATLNALEHIVAEAAYCSMDDDGGEDGDDDKDDKKDKKDKKDKEKDDKDDDKEEDDKDDDNSADDEEAEEKEDKAIHMLEEAQEEEEGEKEDEGEADGGIPSIPLPGEPGSMPDYQQKQHYTKAPAQQHVPGGGYSKPQQAPAQRSLPSGTPRTQVQQADDSGAHGAFESAIDVGIKHDEGMADDGLASAASDLEGLLHALGLKNAAKKDDKKDDKKDKKDKKKGKPSKEEFLARMQKGKKAWYAVGPTELLSLALDYADYDHEDVTEDMAEAFDDIRQDATVSRNGLIVALAKKSKERGSFIFPSTHSKVKSGDHFPIDTEGRARNALARANQYSKAPKWWSGSLQELVSAVARAVHSKYKNIEVSKKSKKPGKG
jgi:hypothetical protein